MRRWKKAGVGFTYESDEISVTDLGGNGVLGYVMGMMYQEGTMQVMAKLPFTPKASIRNE